MLREQWYSACKRVHNFVQIKALRGGEWGLADIRKLDDGLRKRVPVLHYTVQFTGKLASTAQLVADGAGFVQQPGFKMFRNLIASRHRHIGSEHILFERSKVAFTMEESPPLLCTINSWYTLVPFYEWLCGTKSATPPPSIYYPQHGPPLNIDNLSVTSTRTVTIP